LDRKRLELNVRKTKVMRFKKEDKRMTRRITRKLEDKRE